MIDLINSGGGGGGAVAGAVGGPVGSDHSSVVAATREAFKLTVTLLVTVAADPAGFVHIPGLRVAIVVVAAVVRAAVAVVVARGGRA